MKSFYATHGIPEKLIGDSGVLLHSDLMRFFSTRERGIKYNITSPYFPRADEEIEIMAQTKENSLSTVAEEGKNLYMILLGYRIQPAKNMISPVELLMCRKVSATVITFRRVED